MPGRRPAGRSTRCGPRCASTTSASELRRPAPALGTVLPRLYALILSGGAGTRLWPRSRAAKPKQFLEGLTGPRTLLQETLARIAPVAKVAVAGKDNTALAAPAAAPAAALADLSGADVYNQVCAVCHAAAVAGAPKTGDKAAWGPRIAQGMEMLNKHAIEGFQGKAGYMPPKGGRTDLSDQSVVNAVEYLVSQAK